ncbi:MAG: hypothetical protein P4M11_04065 [Candidatus Pacebacteria bacterium]|nr:hypothetical protein [Candidatus Paceibacterota bacterium]
MLNLLTCERANGGYVAYYDNSCGCYSGYHLTLGILGIFTTVVLFVLSLACKAFVFPIKVTAHDPVARLDYSSHPLFHVLRTVLLCALLMFPESSQKVIYLAIELGVTVGLYAIHYFIQMIYSDFAERTMRLLKGFNVWLVFVGGILYVSGTPFTASFIMAVLGGWAMLWLDFYADRGLFSILERAATSPKSIYNFVSVMQMIAMGKKASREWDYLMNCYTCYHFGTCMVGPAAQGTAANVNTEMERRAEVLEGLSQSVNRRLKVEMLLNPTDTMLRMFAVGYILYNTHNYMLAFEIIKGSEVLDLSYQHQFIMRVYW